MTLPARKKPKPRKVRVLVVDDHHATPLASLLESADVEIVGNVASADEAVGAADSLRPDVVLMNLSLPQDHGDQVFHQIRAAGRGTELLVSVADPAESRLAELSPQESRILEHLVAGRTNKEIGRALNLSDKTVKNYLSNAFQKLRVGRRSHAAAIFRRRRERA